MKKINWKVRINNKMFWLTLIPAVLLLAAQVFQLFGITFDFAGLGEQLKSIVGTVFMILTILGVVSDPTTTGLGDSAQAMTYETPKED